MKTTLLLPVLAALACQGAFGQQSTLSPERTKRLLEQFPEVDANKDGTLSLEELRSGREQLRKRGLGSAVLAPQPTLANARYGPHERNVLDFWKASSPEPAPVLVFIHGGGFVAGDKSGANPDEIERFLDAGISFASINYRYTTQAPYPAPMLDGARAIQFLRAKAVELNIDPKRIAAFGGSAGAGISMWLAFHDDLADPASSDPIAQQSTRLAFAGSLGGQSSYDPLQIRDWLGGRAWEHPAFLPFYAVRSRDEFAKPEVRKLASDASVINHLTKDDPPVFMIYNEPDAPLANDSEPGAGIHHPKFGQILKEKMDALGIESVYRHVKDGKSPSPFEHFHEWAQQHLLGAKKAREQ
jgi:acetyl esterase/lipase